MDRIYRVSFIGHREIDRFFYIEEQVREIVEKLIKTKEYVEFYVGRNGEFDQLTASTVRAVRKQQDYRNCSLVLVLPYMTAEFRDNKASFLEYYDEVEVSSAAEGVHFKSAMQTRNREMVDRANLVIFCVDHASGGAYQTLKYAKKIHKPYINISEKGTALGL